MRANMISELRKEVFVRRENRGYIQYTLSCMIFYKLVSLSKEKSIQATYVNSKRDETKQSFQISFSDKRALLISYLYISKTSPKTTSFTVRQTPPRIMPSYNAVLNTPARPLCLSRQFSELSFPQRLSRLHLHHPQPSSPQSYANALRSNTPRPVSSSSIH